MLRVAAYPRVSTQEQADEGYSLDAQLNSMRSFCASQPDWHIVDVYTEEGVSAKDMHRPQLERLIEDVKQHKVDIVLVWRLDRLTRSVLNLHELLQLFEKHNVGFKSVTEPFDTTTAIGRLFITMVAAMAQWERENLGERTKSGQVEMTKQGRWSGGHAAFGYEYVDGELRINEAEASVVREIYRRYTHGEGTTKILQWLNHPDHPQLASNERWTQWALKYVLRNPLYAGYVRYGYRNNKGKRQPDYIMAEGNHEPIIDKEMFERAEEVRAERTKMPARSGTGTYAFSSVLKCGKCGSSMVGRTQYRTNKESSDPRRYYTCTERQHSGLCDMPRIREAEIEEAVLADFERYRQELSLNVGEDIDNQTEKLERSIQVELDKLEQAKQRFLDAFGAGKLHIDILNSQLARIDEQQRKLHQRLEEVPQKADMNVVIELLSTLQITWNSLAVAEKKEVVRQLVEEIEVQPDKTLSVSFK